MPSEDPILLPEIVDQIVLVTVHPASEREDEELQRRRHSLRLLGRLDQHRPSLGRFFAPYGQADDDGYDDDVAPTSATRILGFGHGQVEALLGTLGGTVQLEAFLRDFVKAKGFQRLGRNVRKGLQAELERLARKGKILMKDGIIRLP